MPASGVHALSRPEGLRGRQVATSDDLDAAGVAFSLFREKVDLQMERSDRSYRAGASPPRETCPTSARDTPPCRHRDRSAPPSSSKRTLPIGRRRRHLDVRHRLAPPTPVAASARAARRRTRAPPPSPPTTARPAAVLALSAPSRRTSAASRSPPTPSPAPRALKVRCSRSGWRPPASADLGPARLRRRRGALGAPAFLFAAAHLAAQRVVVRVPSVASVRSASILHLDGRRRRARALEAQIARRHVKRLARAARAPRPRRLGRDAPRPPAAAAAAEASFSFAHARIRAGKWTSIFCKFCFFKTVLRRARAPRRCVGRARATGERLSTMSDARPRLSPSFSRRWETPAMPSDPCLSSL